MENKKKKIIKKAAIVISITIVSTVALIIIFISPIAKWGIEKYSVKYTGRQIKMDWLYLNPFTGYAHFDDLKIYEKNSDTVFFSVGGLNVNFAMLKLPKKTYEISSLTINKPWLRVIQDHNHFNFDDLIEKFSSNEAPDTTKPAVHFNLLNVAINDGEFHYNEKSIPVNYYVKEVNFKSPGMRWDVDSVKGNIYLQSGPGKGTIISDFNVNLKTMNYGVKALIKEFDLKIFEQYLHDLANYGSFTATLDADVKANGNFKNQLALSAKGMVKLSNFHFGKIPGDDYVSFDKLVLDMDEVSPWNYRYYFDSVMLNKPYFKYEKYDYLDNVQRMFGKGGSNIKAAQADETKFNLILEIADYVEKLAQNFLQSYYKIDKVAIYEGDIRFNDYSPREKFAVAADPLYIMAYAINKNNPQFRVSLNTGLKPYGNIGVALSIDPNNYRNFNISYSAQKIPVPLFNPYVITYTSFPLDRGTIELNGNWNVSNGSIESNNHLLVLDPRRGKRIRKKDTKWIPVPLILGILRERSNAIDYEIPITGNLNDPKFNVWDVVGDVLKNIFTKPPTTPYLIKVKNIETEIEKSMTLKWEMRQTTLRPHQEKFLKKVADFMRDNPDAKITVSPLVYSEKEKENLLLFEAKKKYYLRNNSNQALTDEDSVKIDKMSVKDSGFIAHLDKVLNDTMLFTIQEKCKRYTGMDKVNTGYNRLLTARAETFLSYFKDINTDARIKIKNSEAGVPFNGFSYYKLDYTGDIPDKLQEAYEEMNELNREDPRGKYKRQRNKLGADPLIEETEVSIKKLQ